MQSIFRRQLAERLPAWVQRGWVTPEHAERMLAEVGAPPEQGRFLAAAFSVLGVLLIGAGVITFFAANWPGMSKLLRLGVLFGGMWFAYAAAWWSLEPLGMPKLGHALLLLGVILFGANIMLISQMYHIDAHFPNGILAWSLGALVVACVAASPAAMVAALALGTLWSGIEILEYRTALHWPFLVFMAAVLAPVLRWRWLAVLRLALLALLLWSLMSLTHIGGYDGPFGNGAEVYFLHVLVFAWLVVALAGQFPAIPGAVLQSFGTFGALASLYPLTSPEILDEAGASPGAWLPAVLVFAAIAAVLGGRALRVRRGALTPWSRRGLWLLAAVGLLLVINLHAGAGAAGVMALLLNLAYFALLLWLVELAVQVERRALLNMAFGFFALTLVTRYFDTFWSLMDRSLFFLIGGAFVLGLGAWLESRRRRLGREIDARKEGRA